MEILTWIIVVVVLSGADLVTEYTGGSSNKKRQQAGEVMLAFLEHTDNWEEICIYIISICCNAAKDQELTYGNSI